MTEVFFQERFVSVEYNTEHNWIEVIWNSYQNADQLKLGMDKVLELLSQKSLSKVFMDMRAIKGTFTDANEWIAKEWLPKANKAGFRYGVLTCSDDVFTKFATDELIKMVGNSQIKTFCNVDQGKAWLIEQR